jgi:nicotinamidase-related amidase
LSTIESKTDLGVGLGLTDPDGVHHGVEMSTSALIMMDLQQGVVARYEAEPALTAAATAIAAARRLDIPVIYVVLGFRQGFPEVSPRNLMLGPFAASGAMAPGDPGAQIHPAVAPRPAEVVVHKKRVSAFTGSDLAVVLRSLNVDSLTLAGISTSGVVLSTLREAADMDFELCVLSDACADGDDEVHRVLMEKVFPRQARVVSADEWTQSCVPNATAR